MLRYLSMAMTTRLPKIAVVHEFEMNTLILHGMGLLIVPDGRDMYTTKGVKTTRQNKSTAAIWVIKKQLIFLRYRLLLIIT
jgi:hypothetical protein